MNIAYLLIGGNLGNRFENLEKSIDHLNSTAGKVINSSDIYETAAWGMENQPSFLNQAVELETNLSPSDLMKKLLEIEQMMGRIREMKYGPRIIDIDILLYNEIIIDEEHLKIPHPQLPFRKFALEPLKELVPKLKHPISGQTIEELYNTCPDQLPVNKKIK